MLTPGISKEEIHKLANLPACANPCRATRGGAGDSACFLVNRYPKGEGADNTLPETVCKSEQPRYRGQDVLLRKVGSPSEGRQCLTWVGRYIWWVARHGQNWRNDVG